MLPQNSERREAVAAWESLQAGAGTDVEGAIVSSESEKITEGTRRNRQIKTVYCPVYEFAVNDKKYTTQAVGDDCLDSRTNIVLGATATIVHNPSNPEEAFVKSDATAEYYKDDNGSKWVAWVLGIFIALLGIYGIYAAKPKTPEQLAKQEETRRKAQEEFQKAMDELNNKK